MPATAAVIRVGLQFGALAAAQSRGSHRTGADAVLAGLGGRASIAAGAAVGSGAERGLTTVAGVAVAVAEPVVAGKGARAGMTARVVGLRRSSTDVPAATAVHRVRVRVRAQHAALRPAGDAIRYAASV